MSNKWKAFLSIFLGSLASTYIIGTIINWTPVVSDWLDLTIAMYAAINLLAMLMGALSAMDVEN